MEINVMGLKKSKIILCTLSNKNLDIEGIVTTLVGVKLKVPDHILDIAVYDSIPEFVRLCWKNYTTPFWHILPKNKS